MSTYSTWCRERVSRISSGWSGSGTSDLALDRAGPGAEPRHVAHGLEPSRGCHREVLAKLRPIDVVETAERHVGLEPACLEDAGEGVDAGRVPAAFPVRDGGLARAEPAGELGLRDAPEAAGFTDEVVAAEGAQGVSAR